MSSKNQLGMQRKQDSPRSPAVVSSHPPNQRELYLIFIMTASVKQQLIHYSDYPGFEPAFVFVHGFTCDETDFVNQVKHFGGIGHRVITVDLPGHGRSMNYNPDNLTMKTMGSDVVTLLRYLRVKSAIVVGHSMGVMVATEIALQAPQVVIGIALIDGSRFAKGDPEDAVAAFNAIIKDVGFTRCMVNTFEPSFYLDPTRRKRSVSLIVPVQILKKFQSESHHLVFVGVQ